MDKLLSNIKISVPEKIFVKDPESSDLGRRIVEHSILLIDELGFEAFSFKKLGGRIGSNESSVYRYFENKHNLLLYLSSWFWSWKEHKLVLETYSIADPGQKLERAINIITRTIQEDTKFTHVNEVVLNKIIINENPKSFLTKEVDQENEQGYFVIYKRIINRLAEMILAVNNGYEFPKSLASSIVEGSLHQHFLGSHFKSITDCNESTSPTSFFTDLTLKVLKSN